MATEVIVTTEYLDFAEIFLEMSANILLEQIGVNEHATKSEKGKQLLYRPIHSLEPVELKTFKTYIKINLANGFVRTLKSPSNTPILFICKPDGSFHLCVDYWGLNNPTIKNWYPLPLISKSLDWLGQAKCFTQLDLTSTYYYIKIKEGDK